MSVNEVGASLSIYGSDEGATAAGVTAALGIGPTQSYELGDTVTSKSASLTGTTRSHSYWSFEVENTVSSDEDFHGMQSLDRLAELFEPKAAALAALSERYEIRVWMIGHSDSTQGGFVIDRETMRRLGSLSASLWANIYLEDLPAGDQGMPR